jgi:hypothetical protein
MLPSALRTAVPPVILQRAFENWNLANEASGNSSGVRFSLHYSSTVIAASVGGTPETAPTSEAPAGYVYQVNRPPTLEGSNPDAFAQTGAGGTGDYRTSAVTNINSQVTDCDALAVHMAHEIGHTLGLGECSTCQPRGSVTVNINRNQFSEADFACLTKAFCGHASAAKRNDGLFAVDVH